MRKYGVFVEYKNMVRIISKPSCLLVSLEREICIHRFYRETHLEKLVCAQNRTMLDGVSEKPCLSFLSNCIRIEELILFLPHANTFAGL